MRALLGLAVAVVLLGCASSPVSKNHSSGLAAEGAALAAAEHWAALLDGASAQRDARELAAQLQDAAEALNTAAQACMAQPDCDSQRVLRRLLALNERQSEWLGDLLAQDRGDLTESGVNAAGDFVDAASDADGLSNETITALNGKELSELIVLNRPVRAAINEWLTWMRPQLLEALDNYQYLRGEMWPEYEQAGLPEALLFGILAKESAGKVHAVSHAGAAGPLQFMPATGQRLGLGRAADGFDTRYDPQLASRANVRYLQERFGEFNHDVAKALAAYNGGEGRMARLNRKLPGRSFWDPAVQARLPKETRDYVPMVLAAAWLFLHPDSAGLDHPALEPSITQLRLSQPSSLNALAICLGQGNSRSGWFRTLRNLNPRWLPHQPLAAGTALEVPEPLVALYRSQCLNGERASFAHTVAAAAKQHFEAAPLASLYTVRSGDTLAAIARRHQCDTRALASANGIKPPQYLIKPGQALRLNGCRG